MWQHLAGCPQGLSSLQPQCWLGCLLSGGPTKAGSSATLTRVVGRLPHFAAMRLRVTGFCCQLEGALSNDSFLHFLQATHSSPTCRQALTWPESSFRFFWMMLWKELFGQPQSPSGQQRNVCCLEPFNWGKLSPSFKVDSYFRQTHPGWFPFLMASTCIIRDLNYICEVPSPLPWEWRAVTLALLFRLEASHWPHSQSRQRDYTKHRH